MKMFNFADTDERVSAMALGCLPYGTKMDTSSSFAQLDYYLEKGGNFLDTSNNYSFWDADGKGGESEALLGRWFRERGTRERVFLATKLGAYPTTSKEEFFAYKGDPWADLTEGLSRKTILQTVDNSLERLGTDRIDLLYAHVDDRKTDQEETLEALNDVVKAGKVRHIGCSNFKVWRLARAREISREKGWAAYKAVQMFHTYVQSEKNVASGMPDQMGEELFDYTRSTGGLSLLAYTPLLWGSYTRPEKYDEIDRLKAFVRPQNTERRRRLDLLAAETGWTVNQLVYAWMLSSKPAVIPLVAVSRMDHLVEDLAAADYRLAESQMAFLNAAFD